MAAAMSMAVKAAVEAGVAHLGGEWGRRFRSLFWKVRAEVKRQAGKRKGRKQRFDFHYDPLSYALNFDDSSSAFFFC